MANRYLNQFRLTFVKQVVDIFGLVTFGATGAPTLVAAQSKGIVSVTRNGAGKYTFVFGTRAGMLDVYYKLLDAQSVFDTSLPAAAPAAPEMYITANNVSTVGTCSLQVQFAAAGVATDPASGEKVYLNFTFTNSTAP